MKFLEISKPLITQILSESLILEAEGKNTHLEHLEDNIFNKGFAGAKEAAAIRCAEQERCAARTRLAQLAALLRPLGSHARHVFQEE